MDELNNIDVFSETSDDVPQDLGSDREADVGTESRSSFFPPSLATAHGQDGLRAPMSTINSSCSRSIGSSDSIVSRSLEVEPVIDKGCTAEQARELEMLAETLRIEAMKKQIKSETSAYEREKLRINLMRAELRLDSIEDQLRKSSIVRTDFEAQSNRMQQQTVNAVVEGAPVMPITQEKLLVHQTRREPPGMANVFRVIDAKNGQASRCNPSTSAAGDATRMNPGQIEVPRYFPHPPPLPFQSRHMLEHKPQVRPEQSVPAKDTAQPPDTIPLGTSQDVVQPHREEGLGPHGPHGGNARAAPLPKPNGTEPPKEAGHIDQLGDSADYRTKVEDVTSKLEIDRAIAQSMAVPMTPEGWPFAMNGKGSLEEKIMRLDGFMLSVELRMKQYSGIISSFNMHNPTVAGNLSAMECLGRLNRIKNSDESILGELEERKKALEDLKRRESLKRAQAEGKLTMPCYGNNTFEEHERVLSKFEKCGNRNKGTIREWFRKLFAVVDPMKLSEDAVKRTLLMNMQEEPCSFLLDNYSRPLEDLVGRLIDMYDRSYRKPSEVIEGVRKAKRGPDDNLLYFLSDLGWKLDQISETFDAGTFEIHKRLLLKEKLIESVGEHTLRKITQKLYEAEENGELIDIERLCKDANKYETINKDWTRKKSGKINQVGFKLPETIHEDHYDQKRSNSRASSLERAGPEILPDKSVSQVRAEQEHYMKAYLNVMVGNKIKLIRPTDMRDLDSEEEAERARQDKLAVPQCNASQKMTPQDASKYWGDIPQEIAEFEVQVEKTERQRADQAGRNGKWKRSFEQRRVESARPGIAWQYRKDRQDAIGRPGEPVPRYSHYHGPRGNGIALNQRGAIEATRMGASDDEESAAICSRCGWEGAPNFRTSTSPPVSFIANKDGILKAVPLPNVLIEMGHSTRNCPRYNKTATYPCLTCRNFGRISFHFTDTCLETPGSRLTQQPTKAFTHPESPTSHAHMEEESDATASKNE